MPEQQVRCLFLILSSLSTLSSLHSSHRPPMHICLMFLPIMFDKKRALSSVSSSLSPFPSFRPQGRLVATTWQSVKLERPIHAPNRFLFFPAPSTFPQLFSSCLPTSKIELVLPAGKYFQVMLSDREMDCYWHFSLQLLFCFLSPDLGR